MTSLARAGIAFSYAPDNGGYFTISSTAFSIYWGLGPGAGPGADSKIIDISNGMCIAGLIADLQAEAVFNGWVVTKDADVADYCPVAWLVEGRYPAEADTFYSATTPDPGNNPFVGTGVTVQMEAAWETKNPTMPAEADVQSSAATYGDGGNEFTPSLDVTSDNPRRSGGVPI